MYNQLSLLGGRLKNLRTENKITLRQLAADTGLSAGLLSKIENLRTVPSLPVLIRIARALRADLGELLRDEEENASPWRLIRAGEYHPVERKDSPAIDYSLIFEGAVDASGLQMMLVTMPPHTTRKPVNSSGDQLLFILSGDLQYRIEDAEIELHTGDCLFFDGTLPHYPVNNTGMPASCLAIYLLREEGEGRKIRCRKK